MVCFGLVFPLSKQPGLLFDQETGLLYIQIYAIFPGIPSRSIHKPADQNWIKSGEIQNVYKLIVYCCTIIVKQGL
jgi:hypothetical protein